jgi:hypothetical protein
MSEYYATDVKTIGLDRADEHTRRKHPPTTYRCFKCRQWTQRRPTMSMINTDYPEGVVPFVQFYDPMCQRLYKVCALYHNDFHFEQQS